MLTMRVDMPDAPASRLYRVAKGPSQLPKIVERASACGSVRMHAPASLPNGPLLLQVQRCEQTHAAVEDDLPLLLQGRVVSCQKTTLMISHGGLILRVDHPSIEPSAWPNDAEVRTAVRCA